MATKIYVDTLHQVTITGPKKPTLTKPLRDLLRIRGFEVVSPVIDESGNESRPARIDDSVYVIESLILLKSQIVPAIGTVDMEIFAKLKSPNIIHMIDLGPFNYSTHLEEGDFVHGDLTPQGVKRILEGLYLPMVNRVDSLIP